MILLALTIFTSSFNNGNLVICFYDVNTSSCPPFSRFSYSVSNFDQFVKDDIPTDENITFDIHAYIPPEDSFDISRFDKTILRQIVFKFPPDGGKQPEFTITTSDNYIPPRLELNNVKPSFSFNLNFNELSLSNSPINILDNHVSADFLKVDTNSLINVDTIESDSISLIDVFGNQTQRSFSAKSRTENSTLQFISISSLMLKASIVLSNLVFENQHKSTLISVDLSNWKGNVSINYGGLKEMHMVLECLAYSSEHHFPFLCVNFSNRLQIPKSNWPKTTKPLIQITGIYAALVNNQLIISGFIPAHVITGTSDLSITPTIASSGFMKLTVQTNNVTISQVLLFTENYYFFINELSTTKINGNVTIIGYPPLMYIRIGKFTDNPNSKIDYQLIGEANYILRQLPKPTKGFAPTIYTEHLYFESNVTFNFNLEDGAPKIQVLDFVLMETWPTYFIPIFNGQNKLKGKMVGPKKYDLICAKLLKEEKEQMMLPPSGQPRGYNRGATIVSTYYEQDPTTTETLKCFGINVQGDVTSVSNVFCLANEATKSQCTSDSQYISESDNWERFVQSDAGQLTFHVWRAASLSFASFSMVNVTVTGHGSTQKVDINPIGVDHLLLDGLEANLLAGNETIHVELTNTKLTTADGSYNMGPLVTDVSSFKTIGGLGSLNAEVTVKGIIDSLVTFSKGGLVTLHDNQVSFRTTKLTEDVAALLMIDPKAEAVKFAFEEGAGDAIANKAVKVRFADTCSVSFDGLSYASRFFMLDGFTGVIDFGAESVVPIGLSGRDIEFKSTTTASYLTFQSKLDLSGSFDSNIDIVSRSVRVVTDSRVSSQRVINADHFVVLEGVSAYVKNLNTKASLDVYQGSSLQIQNTAELPSKLTVHYNLENLPSIVIGSATSKTEKNDKNIFKAKTIVFSYEDEEQNYNNEVMNNTFLLEKGITMISGSNFDCSETIFDFQSTYAYYHGSYSLLEARCVGDKYNTVKIFVSSQSAAPPDPTPVPLAPTPTAVPNNTRKQVIIISMTVVAFFLIIVIVIIKCMNRKKKYVSKKPQNDLNTQPMLIPNEGNAE